MGFSHSKLGTLRVTGISQLPVGTVHAHSLHGSAFIVHEKCSQFVRSHDVVHRLWQQCGEGEGTCPLSRLLAKQQPLFFLSSPSRRCVEVFRRWQQYGEGEGTFALSRLLAKQHPSPPKQRKTRTGTVAVTYHHNHPATKSFMSVIIHDHFIKWK